MFLYYVLAAIAGAAIGIAIYIAVVRLVAKGHADAIIEKANAEAENIKQQKIFQAKEKFMQLKSEHEKFVSNKNSELKDRENNIKSREGQLSQQAGELNRRQRDLESQKGQLNAQRQKLDAKMEECNKLTQQVNKELESIAGMTSEEAKKMLVDNLKAEARSEAQAYINDTMDEARLNAAREAKRIVINTIQRTATETAIENAVTTFPIENDEVKGRIIGREGRNIRALEAATGVEIVVDDTPRRHPALCLRPRPQGGGQALAAPARHRRAHPSRPHRGGGRQGQQAARRRDTRDRKAHLHRPGHPWPQH